MKTLIGLLLFVTLGVAANGQSAGSRVIAEISASTDKVVKGSPFTAEAVSESVQVLADGNRISRSSTSKLYRNGEGRFRRESSAGSAGTLFGTFSDHSPSTLILDPVGGFRYFLNENTKTIRATSITPALAPGEHRTAVGGRIIQLDKLQTELRAIPALPALPPAPGTPPTPATRASGAMIAATRASHGEHFNFSFSGSPGNSKTEELGTRNIEGIDAEGTRTVTTIEAGAIGNERPIEIVYEKWYSKELQLVVMSRHSDPRFGEQTYRLTNINRSEPDPSLFSLPTEYKLLTEPGSVYRTVAPNKTWVEGTTPVRVITPAPAAKQ